MKFHSLTRSAVKTLEASFWWGEELFAICPNGACCESSSGHRHDTKVCPPPPQKKKIHPKDGWYLKAPLCYCENEHRCHLDDNYCTVRFCSCLFKFNLSALANPTWLFRLPRETWASRELEQSRRDTKQIWLTCTETHCFFPPRPPSDQLGTSLWSTGRSTEWAPLPSKRYIIYSLAWLIIILESFCRPDCFQW